MSSKDTGTPVLTRFLSSDACDVTKGCRCGSFHWQSDVLMDHSAAEMTSQLCQPEPDPSAAKRRRVILVELVSARRPVLLCA